MTRLSAHWPLVCSLWTAAVAAVLFGDFDSSVRLLVILPFILLVPGLSLVQLLELTDDTVEQVTVALGLSIALVVLVPLVMLAVGGWSPELALLVLMAITVTAVGMKVAGSGGPPRPEEERGPEPQHPPLQAAAGRAFAHVVSAAPKDDIAAPRTPPPTEQPETPGESAQLPDEPVEEAKALARLGEAEQLRAWIHHAEHRLAALQADAQQEPAEPEPEAESADVGPAEDTPPLRPITAPPAPTDADRPTGPPDTVGEEAEPAPSAATTEATETCRIEWWRGYVKSEFYAHVTELDGNEYVAARSPAFWWRQSDPPPSSGPAAAAHEALVAELVADGWQPDPHEPEPAGAWWAGTFRRAA